MMTDMTAAPAIGRSRRERIGDDKPWYDWLVIGSVLVLMTGIGLDGWAHFHGATDNTIFTPWHAVLYGGLLLTMIVHMGVAWLNLRRGYPFWGTLPRGYALSFAGIVLSTVAGFLDMLWHLAFGIETTIDALLSPTHLLLVVGFALVLGGPFRAFLARGGAVGWRRDFPAMLSFGFMLAIVLAYLSYVMPFGGAWASNRYAKLILSNLSSGMIWPMQEFAVALGIASLAAFTILVVAVFVAVSRRTRLPLGGWTLVLCLSVVVEVFLYDEYRLVVVAFLLGIFLDALSRRVSVLDSRQMVMGGALTGFVFALAYFGILLATGGVWWVVHVVAGAIVGMAVVGGLTAFVTMGGLVGEAPRDVA